jgi:hypothetical protein
MRHNDSGLLRPTGRSTVSQQIAGELVVRTREPTEWVAGDSVEVRA